ncbi:MAG: cysteine--tRNA ligase, partial [Desulfobulbaceae bacterium]|nr:cysteine--tRNA ligase [Desulfobulbaceae bacterium]
YKVTFVRNFTDIDDKIINRANEQDTTPDKLAKRFIEKFHEDMKTLNIVPPDIEPKATEHIPEIIEIIQELIDRGIAYQAGNDVYYSVKKIKDYGKLSGRNLDDMKAGARISINENKKNPFDFTLWKGSKPGEPTWDSPWGPGRPGWHIECSAMSRKYLGDTFDIHGGGKDLIFPHHENEIAQSEGATGKPFVNTWIHHGFVTIKDEKMSKSLGNFFTIREILERYDPEALRLFMFSSHYRTPVDFSENAMKEATTGLDRLYSCLAEIEQIPGIRKPDGRDTAGQEEAKPVASQKETKKIETIEDRFSKAMDIDFNSAQGLGHLFDMVKSLNRIRSALPAQPAASDLELLGNGADSLLKLTDIIGLLKNDPVSYIETKKARIFEESGLDKVDIENMIEERSEARKQKNWTRADEIRDELLLKNIEIKDNAQETTWTVRI